MTHENAADKSSLPAQAAHHQFKIIKNPDQLSIDILQSQRSVPASAADTLQSQGRGNDGAAIDTIELATPIDKFAYLSIRQSQGMGAARVVFIKPKMIKINPLTPFM